MRSDDLLSRLLTAAPTMSFTDSSMSKERRSMINAHLVMQHDIQEGAVHP